MSSNGELLSTLCEKRHDAAVVMTFYYTRSCAYHNYCTHQESWPLCGKLNDQLYFCSGSVRCLFVWGTYFCVVAGAYIWDAVLKDAYIHGACLLWVPIIGGLHYVSSVPPWL